MNPNDLAIIYFSISIGTIGALIWIARSFRTFTRDVTTHQRNQINELNSRFVSQGIIIDSIKNAQYQNMNTYADSIASMCNKYDSWAAELDEKLSTQHAQIETLFQRDIDRRDQYNVCQQVNGNMIDSLADVEEREANTTSTLEKFECALHKLNDTNIYMAGRVESVDKMIESVMTSLANTKHSSIETDHGTVEVIEHFNTPIEEISEEEITWWIYVAIEHNDGTMLLSIDKEIDMRAGCRDRIALKDSDALDKLSAAIDAKPAPIKTCEGCGEMYTMDEMHRHDDDKLYCNECDHVLHGGIKADQR